MAFDEREIAIVKGMLLRGDRQHDIAAYVFDVTFTPASIAVPDANVPNFSLTFTKHVNDIALELMLYEHCPSSDNLRLIRHFEKGGSGSSGVRV
jgi:hypothetical protein